MKKAAMSLERRLLTAFLVAVAAGLLILTWMFLRADAFSVLSVHNTTMLERTVSYEDGVQIQTASLPEDPPASVMFKTTHTRVEVYAGRDLIYRHGWEADAPKFMKSPGTLWHIVTLPEGHGGDDLHLCLYPVYGSFYGNTAKIYAGSRSACTLERLMDILPILVINCIIVFAGMLSLFLHIVTRKRRGQQELGSFLCIGIFSLVIVVWSLCQCGFLQFLIPDGRTLYFVDFFSFFLFPVPFNLFIHSICRTRYRKGFALLSGVYLANMVLATAVQLNGWLDIFQILTATHALMALNVVYVFWGIRGEIRLADNDTVKRFRLPLYIVITFALAELVVYYFRDFQDTSIFLPVGTITFIIMLVWLQVTQYYQTMLEEEKLAYFEKLANMDILTEALNRNAYEDALKELERQELQVKGTCVVLFDINDMKSINDNFGHEQGDEALKSCHHCITAAFQSQDLAKECRRFQELIRQESSKFEFPFGVSCGYASYDPARDRTVRDVIRRSDEMMYENKKRHHGKAVHRGTARLTEPAL